MQMMLPPALYPDVQARASFVRRMLDQVQQVPGVTAVGTTQATFLPGQSMFSLMYVEGQPSPEAELSQIRHITPGYFAAMCIPVVEGRAIEIGDQIGTAPVCMVSQAFAKKYFPDRGAIGRRVRRAGTTAVWMTLVGVAGDVRDAGLTNEPGAMFYVPYLQINTPTARVSLVARTQGDPAQMAGSIRQAIWQVDRNQPVDRIVSLENVLLEGASAERFRTLLLGLFAIVGLVLAIVGLYAVTSAAVTARTFEASLRLALGARPWTVAARIVADAARHVVAGVAVGLALFYLSTPFIAGLLFQTSAADYGVMIVTAAGMTACALASVSWQSRRLARVSPALGLRGGEDAAGTR
jgi:hypothetical protein